jgi:hypothetical protein
MLVRIWMGLPAAGKVIGGLMLGGAILGHVAFTSGVGNGSAVVHVSAPQVDVVIDGVAHHVETMWDSPVVCELGPGRHALQMIRNGRVVHEESFTLGAGEDLVLAVGDQSAVPRAPRGR